MSSREEPRSESLTEQIAGLISRPVSEGDRERASLHLLDWISCSVAGAATEVGEVVRSYGRDHQTGSCIAIGVGRVAAEPAAFINGALGNILEMDDTHSASIVHPGPVVIPAALACAEELGSSEPDFLDAIVRGYEAVVRVASAVGLDHYRMLQTNSTCGPFGAAAAAGDLYQLDTAAMVNALGNAGTLASGLWQMQSEGVMSKHFHTARAAQTGVTCAHLASKGFTGAKKILEGERGFFATLCGNPHPEAVAAEPNAPWKIHEVGFKPWPACGSVRAPIGAALELRPQLDQNDIVKIEVRTFEEALRFCNNPTPKTTKQARFSLQHAVAVALLEGSPTLESFMPPAIDDPRVSRIRNLVEVRTGDEFSSEYPQRRGADVQVHLRGGKNLRSVMRDAPGDPPNSLDARAIENKARMLLGAGGLAPSGADRIIAGAGALSCGGTLNDVTRLFPISMTEPSP